MTVLNYRTEVPVERTVAELQRKLVKHGALEITVRFEGERPRGLAFALQTRWGERAYRLPVDVSRTMQRLGDEWVEGRLEKRFTSEKRAEMIAWRTLLRWVELQLDMVETGTLAKEEILLPYMVTSSGETVFQAIERGRGQLAITAGGASGS